MLREKRHPSALRQTGAFRLGPALRGFPRGCRAHFAKGLIERFRCSFRQLT
jgi:hypothetical protein